MKLPKLIIQKLDQPRKSFPITGLRLLLCFNILICGSALIYDKLHPSSAQDPSSEEEKLMESEARTLNTIEKHS
jgi:hypothetical protein